MQMRPDIQLKSSIKALSDVVLPAVDPNNKPAQEQARLVIGLLTMMAEQIPLQFQFDCDELQRLIKSARAVGETVAGTPAAGAPAAALSDATTVATRVLEGVGSAPADVEQAVRDLRATLGETITQVYRNGDASSRAAVRTTVLDMSKEQLLRERSWFLMQGWEPHPEEVPPIQSLLAPLPQKAS